MVRDLLGAWGESKMVRDLLGAWDECRLHQKTPVISRKKGRGLTKVGGACARAWSASRITLLGQNYYLLQRQKLE
jgi:hypothetical protein